MIKDRELFGVPAVMSRFGDQTSNFRCLTSSHASSNSTESLNASCAISAMNTTTDNNNSRYLLLGFSSDPQTILIQDALNCLGGPPYIKEGATLVFRGGILEVLEA